MIISMFVNQVPFDFNKLLGLVIISGGVGIELIAYGTKKSQKKIKEKID